MYLTPELKQYYSQDLNKFIDLDSDEFWHIDSGLGPILKRLNENSNIQSLFSKNYVPRTGVGESDPNSYLEFAYSESIKDKLAERLKALVERQTNESNRLTLHHIEPRDNPVLHLESPREIGCLKDPDYFRIYHYKLELYSDSIDAHTEFWEEMCTVLSNL